ncbi:MAG: hypothetical protein EON54_03435 [Alcaligenaceae bacterium]|nr:MAG: hypothetical protein EON54_03435 [Alcaligenaceae bacterium]
MTTKSIEIFTKQALESLPEAFEERAAFYRKYAEKLAQSKPENLFEVVGSFSHFKQVEEEIGNQLRKQSETLFGEYVALHRETIERMRVEMSKTLTRVKAK